MYNSIGHILTNSGFLEDVAYGTLCRFVEKFDLISNHIQAADIDRICDNLEVVLYISFDTKRMTDLEGNIYQLKGSTSK